MNKSSHFSQIPVFRFSGIVIAAGAATPASISALCVRPQGSAVVCTCRKADFVQRNPRDLDKGSIVALSDGTS